MQPFVVTAQFSELTSADRYDRAFHTSQLKDLFQIEAEADREIFEVIGCFCNQKIKALFIRC